MLTKKQAKSINIRSYLQRKGHQPVRTIGQEYYYLSPFRQEQKPSFSVRENAGKSGEDIWQDFGLGGRGGGDIIELVKLLEKCSFQEALKKLESYHQHSAASSPENDKHPATENQPGASKIKLTAVRPLNHFVLLKYLREERHISGSIAKKYLKLVWYENKGLKNMFAIGWPNDAKAYEIRGAGKQAFKAVTGQKAMTTILSARPNPENCFIFEAMLDYLSVLELKKVNHLNGDVIILNSTALTNHLLAYLKQKNYQTLYILFDNDTPGQEALAQLQQKSTHPDIRPQTFYAGFKDVNDYLKFKRSGKR